MRGIEMEQLRESFSQIEDTRHAGYVEHKLAYVLILVMGSVISGITELADMRFILRVKLIFTGNILA